MSEHENAPAALPEGVITRWSYDYVNQGDQLVEREDGGYVLYADHRAALAAATARADELESKLLEILWDAERYLELVKRGQVTRNEDGDLLFHAPLPEPVERPLGIATETPGEATDELNRAFGLPNQHLQPSIAARLTAAQAEAERLRVDGDRRVEAMREAAAMTRPPRAAGNPPNGRWGGEYQCGWDDAVIAMDAAIRALPATPAPETVADGWIRWSPDPNLAGAMKRDPHGLYVDVLDAAHYVNGAKATPAPGPSAEDALRWAWENPVQFDHLDGFEGPDAYVARGLAALTRAPGGQDAPDAARKEGV